MVPAYRNKRMTKPPNGWRYPRVGGTGERYFAGTDSKPHKLPENAQTPTRRVHAVLGRLLSGSNLLVLKMYVSKTTVFTAILSENRDFFNTQ